MRPRGFVLRRGHRHHLDGRASIRAPWSFPLPPLGGPRRRPRLPPRRSPVAAVFQAARALPVSVLGSSLVAVLLRLRPAVELGKPVGVWLLLARRRLVAEVVSRARLRAHAAAARALLARAAHLIPEPVVFLPLRRNTQCAVVCSLIRRLLLTQNTITLVIRYHVLLVCDL